MPAKSEAQRRLFGLALSVKRGDTPRSEVDGDVIDIVDSMSEKEIEKYASKPIEDEMSERQKERQFRGLIQKEIKEVLREIRNR